MGRRARPKNLDADLDGLAPELRWREWMGRVEAVIFAKAWKIRNPAVDFAMAAP